MSQDSADDKTNGKAVVPINPPAAESLPTVSTVIAYAQSDTPKEPQPSTPSLSAKVAHGIAWGAVGAIVGKIVSFVGNLLVFKFIIKEDIGLAQLAIAAMSFAYLVRDGGLVVVLLSRRDHFERLFNDGFWLFMGQGVVATLLLLIAAPFTAWAFGEPSLTPLICLLTATILPASVIGMSVARLTVDLRFGFLTKVNIAAGLISNTLTVLLAWRGFGPYAIVLPLVAMAFLRLAIFWKESPAPVKWEIDWPAQRELLRLSGWPLALTFLTVATAQGGYILLGLFHDKGVVGMYTFAFNLSMQTASLVWTAFGSVLMPAFSLLANERERQVAAFFRSTRLLSVVALPLCVAQALAAEPLLQIFFGHKWDDAILPLQLLSIGTAGSVVGLGVSNLFQAQQRFRGLFWMSAAFTAFFFVAVGTAAALGGAVAVAWGVTIYYWAAAIAGVTLAAGRARVGKTEINTIFLRPVLISGFAALLGWLLYYGGLRIHLSMAFAALVSLLAFGGAYTMLTWRFARADAQEVIGRASSLLGPAKRVVARLKRA